MANYTKTTNFAVKDSLSTGNPSKAVKGVEIDAEFENIKTAITSKADLASPAFTGDPTIGGVSITTSIAGKQAVDAALTSISGLTTAADKMIYTTASDTYAVTDLTSFARTFLDDANAGAVRSTLGVTAANILPSYAGNAGKGLAVNSGATDVEWIALPGSGTVTSVAITGGTTGLTATGGPVTTSGTFTLGGTLAVANGGTGLTAFGTAGQSLRVNSGGTALEYSTVPTGITNVVTATSSTTLTSTPTLLKFSPTAACQKVKLPDATTMDKGANVFVIQMEGGNPAMIVDNGGNILAWTRRNSSDNVVIHLIDNTTSNGVWGFDGVEYWGLEADQVLTFANDFSTSSTIYCSAVELDANKTIIFASAAQLHAVVYDKSTNTFGTPVLVRNGNTDSNFYPGFISSSSVLVVSVEVTNQMQGVVLSISGTTITVNTAGTLTLTGGGHLVATRGYRALVAFGTSWLYLGNSASAGAVMPISVTGTTVVFGTPVATTGLQVGAIYAVTSSVALVISQATNSTITAECFTVSGSTATKNSAVSIASSVNGYIVEQIGTRWAIVACNSTTAIGSIITVSGTVPTRTQITLISGSTTFATGALSYHKIGSQLIVGAYHSGKAFVNVLTDNAGTAVAGTQTVVGTGTSQFAFYYIGGNSTEGWWRNQISNNEHYGLRITISGNNAVIATLWRSQVSSANFSVATPAVYLNGTPQSGESTLMFSSNRAINPGPTITNSALRVGVEKGIISFQNTSIMQNSYSKMLTDSEVWVVAPTEETGGGTGTSTKFFVQKARVV